MPRRKNKVPLTPPKSTLARAPATQKDGAAYASSTSAAGSNSSSAATNHYGPPLEAVHAQLRRLQQGILDDRSNNPYGNGKNSGMPYIGCQKQYLQWLGAKGGTFRGVKLATKTPPTFPVVTRDWVALFLEEVYLKGYQYQSGRKRHEENFEDASWWKKYYEEKCYNKILPDDTHRTLPSKRMAKFRAADEPKQKVITKTAAEAMLKALDDLRRNQLNTIPDAIEMFYSGKNEALRTGNRSENDARFERILVQLGQRGRDQQNPKFSDTIVNALTTGSHLKMLEHYMSLNNYKGALMAMHASMKFSGALRPCDVQKLKLSDMATDVSGKIFDFPSLSRAPAVGLINLGENPDTNNEEIAFYLPHVKDELNLYFYKGHYYFWRWTIMQSYKPDFRYGEASAAVNSVGNATASCKSKRSLLRKVQKLLSITF